MDLDNSKITKQRIFLSNVEVNSLGPELVLEECDIYSDCEDEAIIIAGLTMQGGQFVQQDRPLRNYHFEYAHFLSVRFSGKYVGCDFGDWDDLKKSSIAACDFSSAELDGCRFLNCDVDSIKFPKWPFYTIVNPAEAREFVLANEWPEYVDTTLDLDTDNDPECVAICEDGRRIAKKAGITLEELRALLEKVPGIKLD